MKALEYLFLEISKHAVMRFHASLIQEAREELARLRKIELAAELLYHSLESFKDLSFILGSEEAQILFDDKDKEALKVYEDIINENKNR